MKPTTQTRWLVEVKATGDIYCAPSQIAAELLAKSLTRRAGAEFKAIVRPHVPEQDPPFICKNDELMDFVEVLTREVELLRSGSVVIEMSPAVTRNQALVMRALLDGSERNRIEISKLLDGRVCKNSIHLALRGAIFRGFIDSRSEPRGPGSPSRSRQLYRLTGTGIEMIARLDRKCA